MALTTEILMFEPSDEFCNDPSIVLPAFKMALEAKGSCAPIYYGKQIEQPSAMAYVFLNWDSYESHKALIDSPCYPALGAALKPSFNPNGKADICHVQFSSPVAVVLEKPVTEVLILTLKAPEDREAVVDMLSEISNASGKSVVFGQTREDANKYAVIGGWASVEAHLEAIAKPTMAAAIDKLRPVTKTEHHYHTALMKYCL